MGGRAYMVLARNGLARRLRDDADPDPLIDASRERLSLTVAEMGDTVTRTRMQKIDALFSALPRMVRDTAASLGKSVSLSIEGADVELDRSEEHTSELQSLMRISYAVFCLKKKNNTRNEQKKKMTGTAARTTKQRQRLRKYYATK